MEVESPPDHKNCVVKLWDGDLHFGDISRANGSLVLEVFPRQDHNPWAIPVTELDQMIHLACGELKS
jgi:hypothetical protein